MGAFRFDFTGRCIIRASSEDAARKIFNMCSLDELGCEITDETVTQIESGNDEEFDDYDEYDVDEE